MDSLPGMDMHPDLEQVAFLVGTWSGRGHGIYPTIDDFDYTETISFTPGPGKPFLAYAQRTKHADTGEPLHAEAGFLRSVSPGEVEWVIAQATGITEIVTGTVEGTTLRLSSSSVGMAPTAVDVTSTERHLDVDGSTLGYRFSMAAVAQPFQLHLEATLQRSRDA